MPSPGLRHRTALAAVLGVILFAASCDGEHEAGEFAIFLLPESAQADPLPRLSEIELPEEPLLAMAEIVSYATDSHDIELTPTAVAHLMAAEVAGRRFAVAVGREPIYRGTFMAPWMSRSDDGVVIVWPPMSPERNVIRIELGYPGPDFFRGSDPRSDARVLRSLERTRRKD